MTIDDTRITVPTQALPHPRAPQDDVAEATAPAPGEFPWPEPWHVSRGARPRSEYWDVATASWHSRGPIVPPRED